MLRRRRTLITLVALLVALTPLSSAAVTPSGEPRGDSLATDQMQSGAPDVRQAVGTLDDLFSEVDRRAPGFGGAFIEDDILHVYMLDQARRPEAERALVEVLGPDRIPPGGVQVRQGRFGFAQLKPWHDRMLSLFELPGVIKTDIDERRNRLLVGVESGSDLSSVGRGLDTLGIPRSAVDIEVAAPIVPFSEPTLRDKIRPLEGGPQILFSRAGDFFACTLGFNANLGDSKGFVVNSHCTETLGEVTGTEYFQPLPSVDNFIGTELIDRPFLTENCPPDAHESLECRWSDSAFVERAVGVERAMGSIARPHLLNEPTHDDRLEIAGSFAIVSEGPSDVDATLVGETLNKVGRTTGWTQGQVDGTCSHTLWPGSTSKVLLCQDSVAASGDSGDSGSPVFLIVDDEAHYVELRGIMWGGTEDGATFMYSPIANIRQPSELGDIQTLPVPTFSDVPLDHPFFTEIEWLADQGITGGFPDGTFRPAAQATRMAIVAFFYRYAGEPSFTPPATPTFSDVPTSHPFYLEIEWAADQGLTGGFPDGTFRPSANVTRMAIVAFFYRYDGEPSFTPPATPTFSDVPTSHPFYLEIEWAAAQGLTGGFVDGTFRPASEVTRMAIAAFFYRHAA